MESNQSVLNAAKGKRERLGRLLQMHANKREELKLARAGDIVAAVGLRFTSTGDTLCHERHPIQFEEIDFPDPVISVAIEAKSKADEEKLEVALQRLLLEDPSLRSPKNEDTGQQLIAGMGELHLEIAVERLIKDYKVNANVGTPQVSYREGIRQGAQALGLCERILGGKAQYAGVALRLKALSLGEGLKITPQFKDPKIPKGFWQVVEKTIKYGLGAGPLAGFPLQDLEVEVAELLWREGDSTEAAFEYAASLGLSDALKRSQARLLEPFMKVLVLCPDEFVGDVINDLNGRRGRILQLSPRPSSFQSIQAELPLATMFGYSTALRSCSQGRATFSMEFLRYEPMAESAEHELKAKLGIA